MVLQVNYDLSASRVLHDPQVTSRFKAMRRAGVSKLWLGGYFYGAFDSQPEQIDKARRVLLEEGFDVGVINLPLGHGGNALDPADPNVRLTTGSGWALTMNARGQYRENTTCIDEVMIRDSLEANRAFYQMGFRDIFNDDDLRLGQWGKDLQGCFCPRCMEQFCAGLGRSVTRQEIVGGADPELSRAWMNFQCEKILRFLMQTTPQGMKNGIMVMHNGDRRHGIDIPLLRKEMPQNLIFRVGEGHFDDASFAPPQNKESLRRSILQHRYLVGDDALCYSETTVYPALQLSPENWIHKMEIEISCGLRNLFLMSGSWFFTDPYWDILQKELPRLNELAQETPVPPLQPTAFTWDW